VAVPQDEEARAVKGTVEASPIRTNGSHTAEVTVKWIIALSASGDQDLLPMSGNSEFNRP
jgi:hypothetical protein